MLYWDSNLKGGDDFSQSDGLVSEGIVIDGDTERNTDFVSSGVSLTNSGAADVHLVGDTEFLEISG